MILKDKLHFFMSDELFRHYFFSICNENKIYPTQNAVENLENNGITVDVEWDTSTGKCKIVKII